MLAIQKVCFNYLSFAISVVYLLDLNINIMSYKQSNIRHNRGLLKVISIIAIGAFLFNTVYIDISWADQDILRGVRRIETKDLGVIHAALPVPKNVPIWDITTTSNTFASIAAPTGGAFNGAVMPPMGLPILPRPSPVNVEAWATEESFNIELPCGLQIESLFPSEEYVRILGDGTTHSIAGELNAIYEHLAGFHVEFVADDPDMLRIYFGEGSKFDQTCFISAPKTVAAALGEALSHYDLHEVALPAKRFDKLKNELYPDIAKATYMFLSDPKIARLNPTLAVDKTHSSKPYKKVVLTLVQPKDPTAYAFITILVDASWAEGSIATGPLHVGGGYIGFNGKTALNVAETVLKELNEHTLIDGHLATGWLGSYMYWGFVLDKLPHKDPTDPDNRITDITTLIETYLPPEYHDCFNVPNLPRRSHGEGPLLIDHYKRMLDAFCYPGDYKQIDLLPAEYLGPLLDLPYQQFHELFLLFHDIGKTTKDMQELGRKHNNYPGHDDVSVTMLELDPRLAQELPNRDVLIEVIRLHTPLYAMSKKDKISPEAFESFVKGIRLKDKAEEVLLLLITCCFLDAMGCDTDGRLELRVVKFIEAYEHYQTSRTSPLSDNKGQETSTSPTNTRKETFDTAFAVPAAPTGDDIRTSPLTGKIKINITGALSILSIANPTLFDDDTFKHRIMQDPFLLNGYRLSDLIKDEKKNNPKQIADLISTYYPKGKNTEFINVYPDVIEDPTIEPTAVGVGNIDHTHYDVRGAIKILKQTKHRLPFVHGAVTAFIIVTLPDGSRYLLSTVRATNKKYGGKVESTSGGHIGAGEDIKSAVTRELAEELNIKIDNVPLVGYNRYQDKEDDNTHDFVALIMLDVDQSQKLLTDCKNKGINVFKANNVEELTKCMPDQIHLETGKTPTDYTKELKGTSMAGGREIAYAILYYFDQMVDYYEELRKREGLEAVARKFAWVTTDHDGNFLGNEALIKSTLENFDALQHENNQQLFDDAYRRGQKGLDSWSKLQNILDNEITSAAKRIEKSPADTDVLNLGCGDGAGGSTWLVKEGFRGVHVDFSVTAIDMFKSRLQSNEMQNNKFMVSDILETLRGVDDNSFDIVHAHLSLGYFTLEKTNEIFKEIRRVLRPNGAFVFKVKSDNDTRSFDKWTSIEGEGNLYRDDRGKLQRLFSEHELRTILRISGFKHYDLYPIEVKGWSNGPWVCIADKDEALHSQHSRTSPFKNEAEALKEWLGGVNMPYVVTSDWDTRAFSANFSASFSSVLKENSLALDQAKRYIQLMIDKAKSPLASTQQKFHEKGLPITVKGFSLRVDPNFPIVALITVHSSHRHLFPSLAATDFDEYGLAYLLEFNLFYLLKDPPLIDEYLTEFTIAHEFGHGILNIAGAITGSYPDFRAFVEGIDVHPYIDKLQFKPSQEFSGVYSEEILSHALKEVVADWIAIHVLGNSSYVIELEGLFHDCLQLHRYPLAKLVAEAGMAVIQAEALQPSNYVNMIWEQIKRTRSLSEALSKDLEIFYRSLALRTSPLSDNKGQETSTSPTNTRKETFDTAFAVPAAPTGDVGYVRSSPMANSIQRYGFQGNLVATDQETFYEKLGDEIEGRNANIVAVDGLCGTGKTTLVRGNEKYGVSALKAYLSTRFNRPVVIIKGDWFLKARSDRVYNPHNTQEITWYDNPPLNRTLNEANTFLNSARPGKFHHLSGKAYDHRTGKRGAELAELVEPIAHNALIIVDGDYLFKRIESRFLDIIDVWVFVDVLDDENAIVNIINREGEKDLADQQDFTVLRNRMTEISIPSMRGLQRAGDYMEHMDFVAIQDDFKQPRFYQSISRTSPTTSETLHEQMVKFFESANVNKDGTPIIPDAELDRLAHLLREADERGSNVYFLKKVIPVFCDLYAVPDIRAREIMSHRGVGKGELLRIYKFIRNSDVLQKLFHAHPIHQGFFRGMKRLLSAPEYVQKTFDKKATFLLDLEVHPSIACDKNCISCFNRGHLYYDETVKDFETLTVDEWVALINNAVNNGLEKLFISGGLEPLHDTAIEKTIAIIETARKRNIEIILFTHGNLIDTGNRKLIDALLKVDEIFLSLKATTPETYKKVVGIREENLTKGMEATRYLAEKAKGSGSSLKVNISFLINVDNFRELPDMLKFAQDAKVDSIGLGTDFVRGLIGFSEENKCELGRMVREAKANKEIEVGLDNRLISLSYSFDKETLPPVYQYNLRPVEACPMAHIFPTINPFGGVYVCCHIANPGIAKSFEQLGHITKEHSLKDIMTAQRGHVHNRMDCLSCNPWLLSRITAYAKFKDDYAEGISIDMQPFRTSPLNADAIEQAVQEFLRDADIESIVIFMDKDFTFTDTGAPITDEMRDILIALARHIKIVVITGHTAENTIPNVVDPIENQLIALGEKATLANIRYYYLSGAEGHYYDAEGNRQPYFMKDSFTDDERFHITKANALSFLEEVESTFTDQVDLSDIIEQIRNSDLKNQIKDLFSKAISQCSDLLGYISLTDKERGLTLELATSHSLRAKPSVANIDFMTRVMSRHHDYIIDKIRQNTVIKVGPTFITTMLVDKERVIAAIRKTLGIEGKLSIIGIGDSETDYGFLGYEDPDPEVRKLSFLVRDPSSIETPLPFNVLVTETEGSDGTKIIWKSVLSVIADRTSPVVVEKMQPVPFAISDVYIELKSHEESMTDI